MTKPDPSAAATKQQPRFGKDHFMLADWRVSVAKYQQRKKPDGSNVDFAEYVVRRADGTCQRVTLEAPSTLGLPTAGDEDFLIGVLALAKDQQFASDVVRFIPSRLLHAMRLATTQKNFVRLKKALKRLRAVTVTYESTWYSRATRTVEPVLITGILAEVQLVLRRGRRAADAIADSYVQWTRNFYTSLKEGNLTNLDLDLYFGWQRPGSKHLYRHLNKVWHAGKKPKVYERDLKELACGHLGMTDCKDLKRNFDQIIREMEDKCYLLQQDESLRYQKVRPGVWRVRLEMHPDHVATKPPAVGECSTTKAPSDTSDAYVLVADYHRKRFGREECTPKSHELMHANALLAKHDLPLLQRLLPKVAETVAASYRDQDCHFGAAVPYFEIAAQEHADRERCRARNIENKATDAASRDSLAQHKQEQAKRRAELLTQWSRLTASERERCYQTAIAQETSSTTKARLARRRDMNKPPTEVLTVMAANHPELRE